MTSIAFITTCKGRLHHLRETLPLMSGAGASEVIVVDYGCPDGAGDWVEQNCAGVRVMRVTDDPGFCLARARNIGARHTRADWLVFIDADVKVSPGWVEWMRQHLERGRFYRAGRVGGERDPESYGTVVCARQDFARADGYDEAYRGWGGEDDDFYLRLAMNGVIESEYPAHFVTPIRHGDAERTRWSDIANRKVHAIVNRCYAQAKMQLAAFRGRRGPLDLATRVRLMEQTRRKIAAWNCDDGQPPPVLTYTVVGDSWLPAPYAMRRTLQFSIQIDHRRGRRADARAPRPEAGDAKP